jgi:hypothetical protein
MSNTVKMTVTHSTTYFVRAAIAAIESKSMQAWAQTPHNLPIIRQMAKEARKRNPKLTPQYFAAYLTVVAMGA